MSAGQLRHAVRGELSGPVGAAVGDRRDRAGRSIIGKTRRISRCRIRRCRSRRCRSRRSRSICDRRSIGISRAQPARPVGGPDRGARRAARMRLHLSRVTRRRAECMGVHPGSTNQGDPRWCRRPSAGTLVAMSETQHDRTAGPGAPSGDWWSRRPRRSANDRKIAGVAGGLGRAFGVDPVLIRVGFVILALFGGSGMLLYVLGWLLLPADGDQVSAAEALLGRGRSSTPPALAVGLAIVAAIIAWLDVLLGPAVLAAGHRRHHRVMRGKARKRRLLQRSAAHGQRPECQHTDRPRQWTTGREVESEGRSPGARRPSSGSPGSRGRAPVDERAPARSRRPGTRRSRSRRSGTKTRQRDRADHGST